jgi:tRNA modification GTPase
MSTHYHDDTIVALATAQGIGALAVIRLSGKEAIAIAQKVFRGKNLLEQPTHTHHLHLGSLVAGDGVGVQSLAGSQYFR